MLIVMRMMYKYICPSKQMTVSIHPLLSKHGWIRTFSVLLKKIRLGLCVRPGDLSVCVDALGSLGSHICTFSNNLGVIFDSAFKFEKQKIRSVG